MLASPVALACLGTSEGMKPTEALAMVAGYGEGYPHKWPPPRGLAVSGRGAIRSKGGSGPPEPAVGQGYGRAAADGDDVADAAGRAAREAGGAGLGL